jgi:hypothetical protein
MDSGPDREHISQHRATVAVPGATAESLGAWIMNGGTTTAHIMIPGR